MAQLQCETADTFLVKTLTVKVTMNSPIKRDLLVEDLHDHVALMIRQGYTSGEVAIDDDDTTVRGWWEMTTAE